MKMLKRMLAMLVCCALLLPAAADSPEAFVTINGTAVTRASYEGYLANLTAYYAAIGYDVSSADAQAELAYLALSTLIQITLEDQKIAEWGVALTDAERLAAEEEGRSLWVEDVSSYLLARGVTSETPAAEEAAILIEVLAEFEAQGYTEDVYVQDSVQNALYLKLENRMVEGASVTDSDVAAHYQTLVEADRATYANDAAYFEYVQQLNSFALMLGDESYYTDLWYTPEGYRNVTYILLQADDALMATLYDLEAAWEEQQLTLEEGGTLTGEALTESEVENARIAILASLQATTDEIAARLLQGTAFTDLIPLYSIAWDEADAALYAEGFPVHMDSILYPAGFREAAFSLEGYGDVSEPFVSDDGVYILCYVSDLPGGPVELTEDIRQYLYGQLLAQAQEELFYDTMDAWFASADIRYSDEAAEIMGVQ